MGRVCTLEEVRRDGDFFYIIDGSDSANGHGSKEAKPVPPLSSVSLAPFTREDIATIEYAWHNEEPEVQLWCWGSLKDGRWFVASGEADYTGWG